MIRLSRRVALGVAAGVVVAAGGGCGDDAPAAKPVSKDGQALPEGKTADPAAVTGAKGGRGGSAPAPAGGGRTPKG